MPTLYVVALLSCIVIFAFVYWKGKSQTVECKACGVIVVTGADSGIGYRLVLDLHREGFEVIPVVVNEKVAKLLEQDSGHRFECVLADFRDRQSLKDAGQRLLSVVGERSVFALVNNAGVMEGGPVELMPLETAREIFEINFFGMAFFVQLCMPLLRKSVEDRKMVANASPSRIVNVSSTCALTPLPLFAYYSASKAAIEAFSDSLRRELISSGISVCIIEPGVIQTKLAVGVFDRYDSWLNPTSLGEKRWACYERNYALVADVVRSWLRLFTRFGQSPENASKIILSAVCADRPSARVKIGWDAYTASLASTAPAFVNDVVMTSSSIPGLLRI
mmetsp:Transcript_8098/g.13882  ORF Transcript_8098/g.13882 Transcript_8098/m.13882 type:complete len:334 (+) Transcript_8098:85-1086(+)